MTHLKVGMPKSTVVLLAWLASAAFAQSGPVLDRLKSGGKMVIAHRESSVPFSYLDADKKPVGYALDICQRLVEAVGKKLNLKDIKTDFVLVSAAARIDTLVQGKADMECGNTTNNKDRREKVAFTVPHFITGTRLLVKANSKAERLEDFAGKAVVATKGSTAQKTVISANNERLLGLKVLESPEHTKSVEMVEKGEADAFAMDDVILFSLAANRPDPKALKVVGKFLTIEPLAIMLPKNDPELKKIVDEEMKRLIRSREIYAMYDKWFNQPVPPKGATLNLPVSYLLRDFWKYPTDVVPF
jgi:ABC-type amino acid transport substrate-binding protein